jgi:hypothetical protein
MGLLARYCIAVFDHSFPRPLQKDLLRCVVHSYRGANSFCIENYQYSEANYLRGHKRRADIESEMRNVATRYPGVQPKVELNTARSAYYTLLIAGRVRLTQSRVNDPYRMVRHSLFRSIYAAKAQRDLFRPSQPSPIPIDKVLFALLLHDYDKSDKSTPAFVHVVFPDWLCRSYVARINLLARFPEVLADMSTAAQNVAQEEPQIEIRPDKKSQPDQRETEA